jgi:hypothetical protein
MTDVSSVDFSQGIMISRGSRGSGSTGKMPTDVEKKAAFEHLSKAGFPTKTKAVEYLLDLGWSTTAICQMVRYDSDTKGHKRGDPMLAQHVNHIRQGWLAAKQTAAPATQAPATSSVKKV